MNGPGTALWGCRESAPLAERRDGLVADVARRLGVPTEEIDVEETVLPGGSVELRAHWTPP